MGKDILNSVIEKEFFELSNSERETLKDLFQTETEFNHLKSVLLNVEATEMNKEKPAQATKKRLDDLFDNVYPQSKTWYGGLGKAMFPADKSLFKQPLLQIAAVGLLLLLIVPFFNDSLVVPETKIAKNESVVTQNEAEMDETKKPVKTEGNKVEPTNEVVSEKEVEKRANSVAQDFNEELPVEVVAVESAEMNIEEDPRASLLNSRMADAGAAEEMFDHPDGIYSEDEEMPEPSISYSMSANESVDLLDLLTATF